MYRIFHRSAICKDSSYILEDNQVKIDVASSVPATIAIWQPSTPLATEADLVNIFKNLTTTLALTTTIQITPDDMTEEGVTVMRGILDRENKNGGSDGVASISRIGSMARVQFGLSRDIPGLDAIFFKPDRKAPTATDPGYDSFSDKAGLTTGACDQVPFYVTVIMPHLCGTATTDVERMLALPFSTPRATDSQFQLALNTQYGISGLSIEGMAAPTGAIKGKHRMLRGIKPTT
jgi:hypothetical protein